MSSSQDWQCRYSRQIKWEQQCVGTDEQFTFIFINTICGTKCFCILQRQLLNLFHYEVEKFSTWEILSTFIIWARPSSNYILALMILFYNTRK